LKLGAELGEEILHLDFIFEEGFLNEPLNLDHAARLHGRLLQGLSALWLIGGRSAGVFLDGAAEGLDSLLREATTEDARSNPVFHRAEQLLASIRKEIRERGGPTNPELLQEKYPAAVWHLLDALKRFDSLDPRRVGEITFEVARLGESGLDYANPEKKYTLSAYPGESFSGLQLMCLMYAGFKRIAPEQDTGMDLNEPWITALGLFNAGKNSEGS